MTRSIQMYGAEPFVRISSNDGVEIKKFLDMGVRGIIIPMIKSYEDVEKAMQPMYTTGDPEERAGLGFAVMQSFMDKVHVSSRPGRGTRVTLTKRLDTRR